MSSQTMERPLKVIIVGGGIGGLALASTLQHLGVNYVLLEKRQDIDPNLGASIGILPNGARIIDQLGAFDKLLAQTVSMESSASRREDGSLIGDLSDSLKLMERRTGYPVIFLDRQLVLRELGNTIKDKSRIKLKTSVQSLEQTENEVIVHCDDGTCFTGDIAVGADGVYSKVRHEMWRHADSVGDDCQFAQDKIAMSAEYKCIFGISKDIAGLSPGETDRTYSQGMSTLSYVGKKGRIFWFVFVKMDKVYRPPDIPRFSGDDTARLIDEIGWLPIRDKGTVKVKDLYQRRVSCNLVAIEEAAYKQWSYGRIVCLGDSVHKMTPNLGAGASSALEDASVLSNQLLPLTQQDGKPSSQQIAEAFSNYQTARVERVGRAMQFSNGLTRLQSLRNKKAYIYTHYIAPRADDFAAEMFSSFVVGAPKIDHLPIPARSTDGTMPFNPRQGWGSEEKKSRRALYALPLLVLGFCCLLARSDIVRSTSLLMPLVGEVNERTRTMANEVYSDVAYAIWLLESTRLNNKCTMVQLPILFGVLSQWLGLDTAQSVYLFLLYLHSPMGNFRAADNRLTDVSFASSAGSLIVLLRWLPKYILFSSEIQSPVLRRILEFQPLVLSANHLVLVYMCGPSTIRKDRLWNVRRDVPWLRFNSLMLAGGCVLAHIWSATNATSLYDALGLASPAYLLTTLLWLILTLRDFHQAGMLTVSQLCKVGVTLMAVFVCSGPAGLLIAGWLIREEQLLTGVQKGAVTSAST